MFLRLRLAAEELNLDLLPLREESFDLCFPSRLEADPRIRALIAGVQSPSYRRTIADLPGYDVSGSSKIRRLG